MREFGVLFCLALGLSGCDRHEPPRHAHEPMMPPGAAPMPHVDSGPMMEIYDAGPDGAMSVQHPPTQGAR